MFCFLFWHTRPCGEPLGLARVGISDILPIFRLTCKDCEVACDEASVVDHENHNLEMTYGDTYFALGWGHLEARLQSAFIQVTKFTELQK